MKTKTKVTSTGYNNITGRTERRLSDGSVQYRLFVALDDQGRELERYSNFDAAAGHCQDAAREADSDGEGYCVKEVWVETE